MLDGVERTFLEHEGSRETIWTCQPYLQVGKLYLAMRHKLDTTMSPE